jgi:hypothetical protein
MRTVEVRHFVVVLFSLLFVGAAAARARVYDVGWTFGDDGFGAYRLEALEPSMPSLVPFGRENPTLLLGVGKRYQVQVVNHTAYPLEVVAKGASAAQDRVLLSMGAGAGAFASDPEVNWQDDGQGTVRFTLTPRLFQAMEEGGRTPGYRCRTQAGAMRGDFAVMWDSPLGERIKQSPIVMDFEKAVAILPQPVRW